MATWNSKWDVRKSGRNLRKHGISFEEAASVFGDSLALTFADPDHSLGERRSLTFGLSSDGRLLVVSPYGPQNQGPVDQRQARDSLWWTSIPDEVIGPALQEMRNIHTRLKPNS